MVLHRCDSTVLVTYPQSYYRYPLNYQQGYPQPEKTTEFTCGKPCGSLWIAVDPYF